MKVTLNWLKQYVDFTWSPDELAERLTMLGLEVEAVQKVAGDFEGIVVAEVLSCEKHPDADKLSVCRVADGKGERQIVCGAKNFKVGDKVPLILPGQSLPAKAGEPPFIIKVGKIRGIESQGMMCSPKELGLAEEADGLLILPAEALVGQAFAEHLGRAGGDVVYDLEITPNRPDLNSVLGIAREISALTGNPLRLPAVDSSARSPDPATAAASSLAGVPTAAELVQVRLEDAELCPRYTARVVLGVKIGPSPAWLRQALEKVGLRAINNVVDVTNYVMLETGQPLHAFDYHLIAPGTGGGPVIVVRRARKGEKFVTLDGQERDLTADMLLIADEAKGIALAGIMGGQNSEIHPHTLDVLLESACFEPRNIRATSKRLDLRTDASYRFERGADISMSGWASLRAAQLILETAGGRLAAGMVDAYPHPVAPRQIKLRHAKVDELLGIQVPATEQIEILQRLGLEAVSGGETARDTTTFRVPSFRVDLEREVDLTEEIARLHGVETIPATAPRGATGANSYDAVHDQLGEARRLLTGLGLSEAQGQTLISDESAKLVACEAIALERPLSSDMNVLRPSLLPGLLDSLRHNLRRQNTAVQLFEVGRVFTRTGATTKEERRVALALTGQRNPTFWTGDHREAPADLYDLKGLLEEFLEQFGVRGISYARRPQSTALFAESATIHLGRLGLGELGQVLPPLAKRYDLRDGVFLAELDLDQLLARRNAGKAFKALPALPGIRRDVAMLLPETTAHETVLGAVRQAKPPHLEGVELFDVFRGQNVPAGQKSMAYAFSYRHPDRTLTDAEVNAAHEKLVQHLQGALGAVVRAT